MKVQFRVLVPFTARFLLASSNRNVSKNVPQLVSKYSKHFNIAIPFLVRSLKSSNVGLG